MPNDTVDSAITLNDADVASSGDDIAASALEADANTSDSSEEITVPKEAIMARNSEEKPMLKSTDTGANAGTGDGPGGPDGPTNTTDQFYRDDDRDWGAVATRLIFLIGFGFVAWVTTWLILAITAGNFIVFVLQGKQNDQIDQWVKSLAAYLATIFSYFGNPDGTKPFPLNNDDFPGT